MMDLPLKADFSGKAAVERGEPLGGAFFQCAEKAASAAASVVPPSHAGFAAYSGA